MNVTDIDRTPCEDASRANGKPMDPVGACFSGYGQKPASASWSVRLENKETMKIHDSWLFDSRSKL